MTEPLPKPRAAARWAELVVLFFAVPALFAWWRATGTALQDWLVTLGAPEGLANAVRPQRFMFPVLFLFTGGCLVALLVDKGFGKRRFWGVAGLRREAPRIFALWLIGAAGIGLFTWIYRPEWLFSLPRHRTGLWVAIMCLYPVFSVYPQGVLYRLFFFHRYEPILRSKWPLIFVNAAAFGWMHVVFLNWVAPLMCFAGGLLFAITYHRTRSALAPALEHALYGCWVFTIGIGVYFYGGARIGRPEPPPAEPANTNIQSLHNDLAPGPPYSGAWHADAASRTTG